MPDAPGLKEPTLDDILQARTAIEDHVLRTPLRHYPVLSELLDADVWVKHENFQLLGAFKVRGGINLVSQTTLDERDRGFVTASSGAACTVVLPERANPAKAAAISALGAEVIFHGDVFERSRERAEEISRETGMRCVHAANEPALVAGVATYSLEIHEDLSDIDFIIVPVGAGTGASGACIVTDTMSPSTRVIGAQAALAPAAFYAWQTGRFETYPMTTIAEGLATESAYGFPIGILRNRLQEFVLVGDSEIMQAIERYVEGTRTLVEHAGAAPLAAAINMKERLQGKRVVLIASGGNITTDQLNAALA